MTALWHYTCAHGRRGIGKAGTLLPAEQLTTREVPWPGQFVWLTDMSRPDALALGLTRVLVTCDRTRYRYRVTDKAGVMPYHVAARGLAREFRDELEGVPGAYPIRWFVSTGPVPVVLDPP